MRPYYEEDGIAIYHGDSAEILPSLPLVDLVLTDPPYGIRSGRKDRSHNCRPSNRLHPGRFVPKTYYSEFSWDDAPPSAELLDQVIARGSRSIIWGGHLFSLSKSSCWLVWDKDNSGHFGDCELAWTNLPGPIRKFKWRWNGMLQEDMGSKKEPRIHPTQKPLPLMKWCLNLAGSANTMLDPFMGSGTTLRAAKDLGMRAIGIEIEERYCEVAANRLSQQVFDFTEIEQ